MSEAKVCPGGQPLNRCCMDGPCALIVSEQQALTGTVTSNPVRATITPVTVGLEDS